MKTKTKIKCILVLCVAAALVITVLGVNHFRKMDAVNKAAENLKGKVFSDLYEYGTIILKDKENNITYRFYGSISDFAFHDDGTVTWTRQYDRSIGKKKMTDPVSTTEAYEVFYEGDFWFHIGCLKLRLENGDILDLEFSGDTARSSCSPTSIEYAYSHTNDLYAPEALMHMDTSYISTSSGAPSGTSTYDSSVCSRCSGTGRVTKSFGKTWSKKPGYGYGDVCGACGGTGRK